MARSHIPHGMALLGLSFGLGVACSSGNGGGGGSLTESLEAEQAKGWNIMCSCFAEFSGGYFESQQECLDALDDDDDDDVEACEKEVYDSSTEDDAHLKCLLAVTRDMVQCMGQLECADFEYGNENSGWYACYDAYYMAYEACPQLPPAFEEKLDECWEEYYSTTSFTTLGDGDGDGDGDFFECADGEYSIPLEFVCDGDEDCDDGSDEVDCAIPPEDDDHEPRSKGPKFQRPKLSLYSAR